MNLKRKLIVATMYVFVIIICNEYITATNMDIEPEAVVDSGGEINTLLVPSIEDLHTNSVDTRSFVNDDLDSNNTANHTLTSLK
jgi:hypothetical protein